MTATGSSANPSVAVITLCSTPRLAHVRASLSAVVALSDAYRVVVWIGEDSPPRLDADLVLRVPPGVLGLRLAAARNAGAKAALEAHADLLIFLDADCVPGRNLFERYRAASSAHPGAVLCGPVTYLPSGVDATDLDALEQWTAPHRARPDPADGTTATASYDQYSLFWSLSFAVTARTWANSRLAFDEEYEGYGGEDTDFAFALRRGRVPLVWVGGAHAYHQYHATSSPPWEHLDDILRNGYRFVSRWGEWPMRGWLESFADAGAIDWAGDRWVHTAPGSARPGASGLSIPPT